MRDTRKTIKKGKSVSSDTDLVERLLEAKGRKREEKKDAAKLFVWAEVVDWRRRPGISG